MGGLTSSGIGLNELEVEDEPVVQIGGDIKLIWIEKSKISGDKLEILEKKDVDVSKSINNGIVKLPVYSNLGRTKEVFNFIINSENPNKWIQLGVSIFI